MDKTEVRAVIKYLFMKGMNTHEILDDMIKTLGKDAPKYTTVKKWVAEFKRGRKSTDDPRAGRPEEVTTEEKIQAVHEAVLADRRSTVRYIAETCGISAFNID